MEWKTEQLGNLITIKYGKDHKKLKDGPFPVYGSGGIMRFVDTAIYNKPSLLLPRKGSLNNIMFTDKPFWTVDTMFWSIIDESKIEPKFLYYAMCKKNLVALNVGTSVPSLTVPVLEDVSIPYPPIPIQRKIAGILSALDSKIENNNKINANLEAQAEALFKSWFVDFTPFKDQTFVDSELGPIPQGLKICQISDISHTLETGRRQKGGAVSEGIPSVGAEHVKGIGTYDYSKTKYISPEFANKLKTGKINGYELLIYKDGGKPGYFIPNFSIFGEGYPFDLCYLNEHVFKLDFLQNKGYNIFNYFQFKTNYVMSFLNAQGGKAAIPGINKKDIECIYTFAPNNPKVVEFGNFALPLFTKILRNCVENQRLAALRDTLLPKLMSGEIKL